MLVERMGSTPERTVMIGDSIHDVEAAHGAGLPAVLVSWGYTATPASELGAEAVIQRFDALPQRAGRNSPPVDGLRPRPALYARLPGA